MFRPNESVKIEMIVPVEDALRAMVVLGRTNGSGSGAVYNAIRDALDPDHQYRPPACVNREVGTICYVRIEDEVKNHFFTTHQKKLELREAEKRLVAAKEYVAQLKLEIGE